MTRSARSKLTGPADSGDVYDENQIIQATHRGGSRGGSLRIKQEKFLLGIKSKMLLILRHFSIIICSQNYT